MTFRWWPVMSLARTQSGLTNPPTTRQDCSLAAMLVQYVKRPLDENKDPQSHVHHRAETSLPSTHSKLPLKGQELQVPSRNT
jgi:hypothetical protein